MSKQNWIAEEYSKHASFVSNLATDLIDLLGPVEGKKILDLGCGNGELGAMIQKKGAQVIGIDSSASMVSAANHRGLEAYVMDGQYIQYVNEFDAVFSNAALHWFTNVDDSVGGIYKALKADGIFLAEFGGHGNIAAVLAAMKETFDENPDFGQFVQPWYFPTAEEYQSVLSAANFSIESIQLYARPTKLESGMKKWLEIFAEAIVKRLSDDQKCLFFETVEKKLKPILYSKEKGWIADYVRLRIKAKK